MQENMWEIQEKHLMLRSTMSVQPLPPRLLAL
jgi:hypothetical protein